MPTPARPLVEIDATELTYEEWFFLWCMQGTRPDAKMHHIAEYQKRVLGMTPQQKQMTLRLGLEALVARGFITYVVDADGNPVKDADGQPVFEAHGRVISRMREAKPTVSLKT